MNAWVGLELTEIVELVRLELKILVPYSILLKLYFPAVTKIDPSHIWNSYRSETQMQFCHTLILTPRPFPLTMGQNLSSSLWHTGLCIPWCLPKCLCPSVATAGFYIAFEVYPVGHKFPHILCPSRPLYICLHHSLLPKSFSHLFFCLFGQKAYGVWKFPG